MKILKLALYGALAVVGATLFGCKHSPPPPEPKHLNVVFGTTELGTTREEVVMVTGITGDISVSSLPSLPAPYSIVNDGCSNTNVTPSDGCNFTIRFSPTAEGSSSYSFDLPWNADHAMTVHMSGNGVTTGDGGSGSSSGNPSDPDRPAAPEDVQIDVSFGEQPLGTTREEIIALQGTSISSVDISQLPTLPAPFRLVDDGCSNKTISLFTSCKFILRFEPTTAGSFRYSFDVPTDADHKFTVSISGNGLDAGPNPPPNDSSVLRLELEAETKALRFTWSALSEATHYRLMENTGEESGFVQVGSDFPAGTTSTRIELPVHLFAWDAVRYRVEACLAEVCDIRSNEVDARDVMLDAIGYFKTAIPSFDSQFGLAVALSRDGNTLAVGAAGESGSSVIDFGAVYVFARNEEGWYQQSRLIASNNRFGHAFGSSVALSADGNVLVVGAPGEDSGSSGINGDQNLDLFGAGSGAAYVFTRSGTNWNQTTYIKASNTDSGDRFGSNVALSTDGNTLAVAAPGEDSSTTNINGEQDNDDATDSGAVYVFTQATGTWRQQGYLKASNAQALDGFGSALALSGNGAALAVSAQWEDSNAPGVDGNQNDNSATNSGAVYVFARLDGQWIQQSYVKATIPSIQDEFGSSVALNSDGTVLAVGAHQADGKAVDSGAVYLYERDDSWREASYLTAPDAQAGDAFGGAVALNDDGLILAVGASREDGSGIGVGGDLDDNKAVDSGAVYMFTSDGVTHYVKARNTRDVRDLYGNPDGDRFGFYGAVALSGSGLTLAVGAPWEDGSAAGINNISTRYGGISSNSGAIYLY